MGKFYTHTGLQSLLHLKEINNAWGSSLEMKAILEYESVGSSWEKRWARQEVARHMWERSEGDTMAAPGNKEQAVSQVIITR